MKAYSLRNQTRREGMSQIVDSYSSQTRTFTNGNPWPPQSCAGFVTIQAGEQETFSSTLRLHLGKQFQCCTTQGNVLCFFLFGGMTRLDENSAFKIELWPLRFQHLHLS